MLTDVSGPVRRACTLKTAEHTGPGLDGVAPGREVGAAARAYARARCPHGGVCYRRKPGSARIGAKAL